MGTEATLEAEACAGEAAVAEGAAAPDAAAVEEEIGLESFGDGHAVFKAHREAAVTAEQALGVAAHAVHAADVEHLGGWQVLRARELAVDAHGPRLAVRKVLAEEPIHVVFAEIAVALHRLCLADGVGVLLVPDGRAAVVELVVERLQRLHRVVDPGHAEEVRARVLVAVVEANLGAHRLARDDGIRHEKVVGIRMAADFERLERSIRDVDAVRRVVDPDLAAHAVERRRVARGKRLCALRGHRAQEQHIAVARQAAVLPEEAAAIEAARLIAGIVGNDAELVQLRLADGDDVVRRADLGARLHHDVQLSVVRRVEAQQLFVEVMDVRDFALLQRETVADVILARRAVVRQTDLPRPPLDELNLDDAVVDRLRPEEGPAGHIASFLIKRIYLIYQGIEVR